MRLPLPPTMHAHKKIAWATPVLSATSHKVAHDNDAQEFIHLGQVPLEWKTHIHEQPSGCPALQPQKTSFANPRSAAVFLATKVASAVLCFAIVAERRTLTFLPRLRRHPMCSQTHLSLPDCMALLRQGFAEVACPRAAINTGPEQLRRRSKAFHGENDWFRHFQRQR